MNNHAALVRTLRQRQGGFTIVEILIVIAIAGALFVAAAVMVSGEQGRVAFREGLKTEADNIRQTISAANTGYYNYRSNFTCRKTADGPVFAPAAGKRQGNNKECVILGEAMEYGLSGRGGARGQHVYKVIPIAGLRDNNGHLGGDKGAKPRAIMPGGGSRVDASQDHGLANGLKAVRMQYGSSGGSWHDIGAFAFRSTLGDYQDSQPKSGSQQLELRPVLGSGQVSKGTHPAAVARAINANLARSPVNPSGGVRVCFDGGNGQSGLVTVGGGRALSVTTKIMSGRTCGL